MYIPTGHLTRNSAPATPPGGWSSLIGIITAIIGNILISFALNTQRYAHIKLSRDRDEWEEKQRAEKEQRQAGRKDRSYGTTQVDVAERRAKLNAASEPERNRDGKLALEESHEAATEEDALIPHIQSSTASSNSENTMKQGDGATDDGGEYEEHHDKSYLRSPVWWAGITLMTVGEAGNFLAYGFAPASIVSPLGVVALVSNCLIAPLLLGERFRWRDVLGVLIAIGGCVTVVLSASDSNPKLDQSKIWKLITQWEFETYLGITVALILVLTWASTKYGHRTILIDLGLVGLYGAYTVLSTKGISSLLSNTIWRVVTFPITYLLLAVLIFTAVMQIKYVNRALQHFNATMVIPTQFVMFTISVIVGSAILYRDFERQEPGDAAKFFGGCALTFLGVWCITSGRHDDEEADDGSEDEEDAIDLVDEEHTQHEIREREDGGARRRSIIAGSSQDDSQLSRYQTRESIPQVIITPDLRPSSGIEASPFKLDRAPSPQDISDAAPALTASVHPALTQIAPDKSSQPPPLHATTSEPVVPRSEFLSTRRPRTPLLRNKTGPAANDSPTRATPTSARRPSQAQLETTPRLLSRHSVAGLLPGPLMSPLSTSLTAIVADSLRRGVDNPTMGMRRRPSRRRAGTGMSTTAQLKRHSIASGEMAFDDDDGNGGDRLPGSSGGASAAAAGRNRSLSATWNDIFGGGASSTGRPAGTKAEGKRSGSLGEEVER
ncbi:hypothetical protein LTR62_006994 [Meristemomyces frigidus]|uniref:DUF803 domain membrane protein n=1 Tax=Meristemomyces frigidus TaxID=1508187 RepID=A0AAN7TMU0_9PEZI|nr:hypothetical protein LTR62_006994 [Meristemomyces frigidus]